MVLIFFVSFHSSIILFCYVNLPKSHSLMSFPKHICYIKILFSAIHYMPASFF